MLVLAFPLFENGDIADPVLGRLGGIEQFLMTLATFVQAGFRCLIGGDAFGEIGDVHAVTFADAIMPAKILHLVEMIGQRSFGGGQASIGGLTGAARRGRAGEGAFRRGRIRTGIASAHAATRHHVPQPGFSKHAGFIPHGEQKDGTVGQTGFILGQALAHPDQLLFD